MSAERIIAVSRLVPSGHWTSFSTLDYTLTTWLAPT